MRIRAREKQEYEHTIIYDDSTTSSSSMYVYNVSSYRCFKNKYM